MFLEVLTGDIAIHEIQKYEMYLYRIRDSLNFQFSIAPKILNFYYWIFNLDTEIGYSSFLDFLNFHVFFLFDFSFRLIFIFLYFILYLLFFIFTLTFYF